MTLNFKYCVSATIICMSFTFCKRSVAHTQDYHKCLIESTKYDLKKDSVCFHFYQNCSPELCSKMYDSEKSQSYFMLDTNKVYFTDDTSKSLPELDSLRKYFWGKKLPDTRYPTDEHPTAFLDFILDKEGNVVYKGASVNFSHFSKKGLMEILNLINIKFKPHTINGTPVYSKVMYVVYLDKIKWEKWTEK